MNLPDKKDFIIPDTFKISRLAPTKKELQFMHDWLVQNNITGDVLEFGSGVTSWAIYTAVRPMNYVAIEDHPACLASMKDHLPQVKVVDSWENVPRIPYGVVFVDSSAGYEPAKTQGGIFRKYCAEFGMKLAANDAVVMLHDIHIRKAGYQQTRQLVLDQGYKEVATISDRTGLGIYRK